ncbi:MAG TPA: hypothetical protein VHX66_15230 [Solirubrobacteraceae bacterium]|jgi:hypothetical protein|nr:hypothetical protein [Solirubrobacteraceae bacterium]
MRFASRALCLAVVICATVVTTALAVTPPAGTPDLSQMTIQAGDLAPGAKVVKDGYVAPASNVVASYTRAWQPAPTAKGSSIDSAISEILLLATPAKAAKLFGGERRILSSKADRPLLARIFSDGAHSKIKPKKVHFGRFRSLAIGDGAFVLPLTIREGRVSVTVDLDEVKVSDVLAELTVVAHSAKAAAKGGDELATDVAGHISTVLAATGSTGPTGATGPTS